MPSRNRSGKVNLGRPVDRMHVPPRVQGREPIGCFDVRHSIFVARGLEFMSRRLCRNFFHVRSVSPAAVGGNYGYDIACHQHSSSGGQRARLSQSESRIVRHENEPRETRFKKTTSCGGESSRACDAFCVPAFADPFQTFLCPKQAPCVISVTVVSRL